MYRRVEHLPTGKKEIETVVVRKFLAVLADQGRILDTPSDGDPWPDFLTADAVGQIGIEVAEVIIPEHAVLAERQRRYAQRVIELLVDVLPRMHGLDVVLDDGYQDPPYPSIASKAGQRLAEEIAKHIREWLDRFVRLEVGQVLISKPVEPNQPTIRAICQRIAPPESPAQQAMVRYTGTFPILLERAQLQLTETVLEKINKHYTRFDGKLWLLTYGSPLTSDYQDAESIEKAKATLATRDIRPFDEIWFVQLLPGLDRASAIPLSVRSA